MFIDAGSQRIERNGSSVIVDNGIATGGTLSPWNSPTNRLVVADPPSLAANELSVTLACTGGAGKSCPNTGTANSEVHVLAATFTLLDAHAPTTSNVGGPLTADGPKQGVQTIQFSAADAGVGIYHAFLDVDGVTRTTSTPDTNGGRCVDAVPANTDPYEFQHRVPCPLQLDGIQLSLDTKTLSDGAHTVRVRLEDAAGNQTTAYGPTAITVSNAAPATPTNPTPTNPTPTPGNGNTGNPGDAATTPPGPGGGAATASPVNGTGGGPGARLEVVVLRSTQHSVRVAYGRRVTVSGRLTSASGEPVANATVEVLAQTKLRGAQLVRVATVQTDRAGGFRYVVPAGPSRLIRFGYRAHLGDSAFSRTTDVDVRVTGRVSLRVSRSRLRNGQTVRYTGTVAGVGVRRPLVQIQVRQRGRWINVCVVRTRSRGKYSCAYRFRRTFTPTTYTFRALVRKQEGLPYETASSPRRAVRVRP
jgi:hypothetical protein